MSMKNSKFGSLQPSGSAYENSYSSNSKIMNVTQYANDVMQDLYSNGGAINNNNAKTSNMQQIKPTTNISMAGKSPRSQMAFLQNQRNENLEQIVAKLQQDNAYLVDMLNAAKLDRDNIARKIEKTKRLVVEKGDIYSNSTATRTAEEACFRKVIMREKSKFEQKIMKQNEAVALRQQILIEWSKVGTKICVEQPYIPVKGILEVTCNSVPKARVASLQLYKDYITNLKAKAIKSGNKDDIDIFSELHNKITSQLNELGPTTSIAVPNKNYERNTNMESKYGEIGTFDNNNNVQDSYLTTILSPPNSGRVRTGYTRSRQKTPGGGYSDTHPSTAASSILQATNYFLGEDDNDFDTVGVQENAPVPRMVIRNRTENSRVRTLDEINLLDAAKALGFTEEQLRKMNFGQKFKVDGGASTDLRTGSMVSISKEPGGSYVKDFDAVLQDIDAEINISQRNKNNLEDSQMELTGSNQMMDNESNWMQSQQNDVNLFTNYLSQEYGDEDDENDDEIQSSHSLKKQFQHTLSHKEQQNMQQRSQEGEPVIPYEGLVDFILDFVDDKEATRKKPSPQKATNMAKKLHAP